MVQYFDTKTDNSTMQEAKTAICPDRRRLAEEFAIATRAYSDAVVQFATHRGTTSEAEYQRLRGVMDQAQQDSENTGTELQRHVTSHRC